MAFVSKNPHSHTKCLAVLTSTQKVDFSCSSEIIRTHTHTIGGGKAIQPGSPVFTMTFQGTIISHLAISEILNKKTPIFIFPLNVNYFLSLLLVSIIILDYAKSLRARINGLKGFWIFMLTAPVSGKHLGSSGYKL